MGHSPEEGLAHAPSPKSLDLPCEAPRERSGHHLAKRSVPRELVLALRGSVRGELERPLPYQGCQIVWMNFASPASRRRGRSPNNHAFMRQSRSAP
jgi:hypothetical protein